MSTHEAVYICNFSLNPLLSRFLFKTSIHVFKMTLYLPLYNMLHPVTLILPPHTAKPPQSCLSSSLHRCSQFHNKHIFSQVALHIHLTMLFSACFNFFALSLPPLSFSTKKSILSVLLALKGSIQSCKCQP